MEFEQELDIKSNCEKRIGVGVIFIKNNSFLLGQRLSKNGKDTYGPPGGHVMKDESTIDAAVRKVKEETGYYLSKYEIKCPPFIFETFHKEVNTIYTSYLYAVDVYKLPFYGYTELLTVKNMQKDKQENWQWIDYEDLCCNGDYYDKLFYPFQKWIDLKMKHEILSLQKIIQ